MAIVRPSTQSDSVAISAAESMFRTVPRYVLGCDKEVEELASAIRMDDTLQALQWLTEQNWEVRDDLISAMLNRQTFLQKALDAEVKTWVATHGIVPQKAVGDTVRGTLGKQAFTGDVVKVNEILAQYQVRDSQTQAVEIFDFEAFHPLMEPAERYALRAQGPGF